MRRIYLDNAATSFPKPGAVWDTYRHVAEELGAPVGRGSYESAREMDRVVEEVRARLGRFFGCRPERVIFTLNATDALNIAIKGSLTAGDRVVTSAMEHNSVMRPLESLRRSGKIDLEIVPADSGGRVDLEAIDRATTSQTRLVALTHASNVCGTLQPVRDVARLCRARDIRFLVDAAQTAGSRPLDLARDEIDLVALPGHKGLLGPPGTGLLLLGDGVEVEPWREGGTGTRSEDVTQPGELPHRLEAGSPNGPAIAALGAAVAWIEEQGLDSIRSRLDLLGGRLLEGLRSVPELVQHGPDDLDARKPVFSINFPAMKPHELSGVLDASFGIETRAGLHCAPSAHGCLGTHPTGSVRISPGPFTLEEDLDILLSALSDLSA